MKKLILIPLLLIVISSFSQEIFKEFKKKHPISNRYSYTDTIFYKAKYAVMYERFEIIEYEKVRVKPVEKNWKNKDGVQLKNKLSKIKVSESITDSIDFILFKK